MFCNFCEKFENSKWPPFLVRQNFFENWHGYSAEISYGSKISSKSLYLARFSRYKHFLCFAIFAKNSKIKNGRHFWREKIFFKIGITTLQRYPVGQKISSKSLYLARFSRYKHFCVLQFLRKFRKFKNGRRFWREKFFFENWEKYSAEISCGSKILSKLLYLARFFEI